MNDATFEKAVKLKNEIALLNDKVVKQIAKILRDEYCVKLNALRDEYEVL